MTMIETRRAIPADRLRPVATIAAIALGLGAGIAFGQPVLALLERAWMNFLLPAYLEIQKSGIPFCG